MEEVAQRGVSYLVHIPRYHLQTKSRRVRWAGHVACIGEGGKVKGNLPLGRQRLKWEDVIRMDLGKNGWRVVFSWLGIGTGGGLL
jgi:hypothetical protein